MHLIQIIKNYPHNGYNKGVMYSYHNRIKQRIANGELVGIKEGKGDFAIVLVFRTTPYARPIRYHSLWRYEDLLRKIPVERDE